MMFRSVIVALLASYVVAEESAFDASGSIPVRSNAGQELMMKATVIEEARFLNNNQDYSWMANYSIRYTGCTSLVQVNGQGGNNNKDGQSMLFTQHLVKFSLCPVDTCASSCSGGGHYVVGMADFVDLYTESKLSAAEYACEQVREECYCDDANDDEACESACYATAGLTDCEAVEGDDFEVQRYLECAEMKDQGNNNKNGNNYNYGNGDYYYGQYYIGPYCPDGKNIMLGLFYDQGCSAKADISQYASRMGGETLPYSTSSMVIHGDCIACKIAGEDNGDGEEQFEIAEICDKVYEEAAKCEEGVEGIQYPDSSACEYINTILPKLDAASRSIGSKTSTAPEGKAAKAFAFIFAFTTVLFGAYAYFLYRKIKRGVVALAAQGN